MAGPIIPQQNPISGPGSQMPDPMGGPGAPLGGGGNVKPQGMPGKPPKDKPEPLKDLDKEAFKTLVDDIYRAMHDSKVKAGSVEEILDYLLGYNWTENRFLELSKYLNTTIRSLILSITLIFVFTQTK